jgi:CTP:phosphocholine cytidylyltransferase-like protein
MIDTPLNAFCIDPDATLLDALNVIDKNASGIALIVEQGRLIATFTDGDARRALIKGHQLSESALPFAQKKFITASPQSSRAEILDIMQARTLSQIPIVDGDDKLVGLHLLHEVLGSAPKPNVAVLMAGGRGKRLGPLTNTIPKPMLKVAGPAHPRASGSPPRRFGITRIYISVHYLPEVIRKHFGDGSAFGCEIHYLEEEKPLGTGGCLSLIEETLDHPLFVCNGDLVTQVNVEDMLSFHHRGSYAATIGIRTHNTDVPFGVIESTNGRVTAVVENRHFPTISIRECTFFLPNCWHVFPVNFIRSRIYSTPCWRRSSPSGLFPSMKIGLMSAIGKIWTRPRKLFMSDSFWEEQTGRGHRRRWVYRQSPGRNPRRKGGQRASNGPLQCPRQQRLARALGPRRANGNHSRGYL